MGAAGPGYGEGFEFEVIHQSKSTVQPTNTELWRILETTLLEADPGCHVTPYMMTGFSDAGPLSDAGIITYGFSPMKIPEDINLTKLPHGHDERLSIEGFKWGVKTFWLAVERFCVDNKSNSV